ncbi:apyrase-like [Lycium ferocissimum]|uniref:apyrase-like n=1 Tax=Lycium ferocissimum TaxID=112874 RepID=UPI0028157EBA|nr:apyrase-like [Lycium ferocissimum]
MVADALSKFSNILNQERFYYQESDLPPDALGPLRMDKMGLPSFRIRPAKDIGWLFKGAGKMLNQKNRCVLTAVAIILLVLSIIFGYKSEKYAVIFDAGSTGSRVHVFRFNKNMELLPIGKKIEYVKEISPGLSAYAEKPKDAAQSLEPLLHGAEGVVSKELQSKTPLELGATAGLRMLKGHQADEILQAKVRNLFKSESIIRTKDEWVTILNGTQEGSYMWAAMNYLLGNLGKSYKNTTATIDLGGGSVQMAYAISKEQFEKAPENPDGEPYVLQKHLIKRYYYLYVHSYLNYGQLAGRAEIFKTTKNDSNPCVLQGYDGYYSYGGVEYRVQAPANGSSVWECQKLAGEALNITAPCKYDNCTFNGAWNGGGGYGFDTLHASSFFYDIAVQVDIIDPVASTLETKPIEYLNKAIFICELNVDDIKSIFPNAEDRDIPYLCMDLVYQYTLLVDGFGLDPYKDITVTHDAKYKNYLAAAA